MSNRNMVELIKENKIRILVVSIAVILAIIAAIAAGCAASGLANEGADSSAAETIAEDSHDAEVMVGEDPEAEATEESEVSDSASATDASSEGGGSNLSQLDKSADQSSPQNGSGETEATGASSSTAQGSSSQTPQKKWVEDTESVWIVDTAAWTEEIPIYSTSERSICNICGADITGNTTAHSKAHMLAGEGSGYHSEVTQMITGYNTIQHPEVGHWETRVTGGHWE